MIRVNLLPPHLRPIRRSPIPYLIGGGILLITLVGIVSVYISNQAAISRKKAELEQHKKQLAELEPIRKESDELEALKARLADKINTIAEITGDRIIWSRQLYNLARLAPKNFWYKSISLEEKQYREQQPVYDKQTKQTKMQTVTVTKPILKVEGYVTEAEDGTKDASLLMRATEADEEFSSMFQLEPPSFKDTEFEGVPVKSFTLEYLIQPRKTGP
ncbi:MAG TPA: hypothetical protein PKY35_00870 [Candidatus Hydrogenedentes bacterium]|nr:hypothetical protein [Candidatus Hydrogenedentota bacterium]HOL75554.1 hypothetical protein [Candidatus Hydrogenedentota bacterium]HPO87021.1 hypothetical protein [Candidatus Hydrogenedentota bacterium]